VADSRSGPPGGGFVVSYAGGAKLWCTRRGCGWAAEVRELGDVDRMKVEHVAKAHTNDPIGSSGP
jgi:hypothetical protein